MKNRKERRSEKAKSKRAIKRAKKATNAMQEKMLLFEALPDKCLTCTAPFDKTNRKMVMSWNVVVREKQEKVNLYCPRCWSLGVKVVQEFQQHASEAKK